MSTKLGTSGLQAGEHVRDRPIIFSAPMVRALLAGRKTQTRRVLGDKVPPPPDPVDLAWPARKPWPYLDAYCSGKRTPENPRGMGENWAWWTRDDRPCEQFRVGYVPGDRLWVREAVIIAPPGWTNTPANPMGPRWQEVGYLADTPNGELSETAREYGLKASPSIHMPRWASRLTLNVTDVRVHRLQEISEDDALAEGVKKVRDHCYVVEGFGYDTSGLCHSRPTIPFAQLWDKIHGETGPKSWESNPWVVAISFAVEKRNIDAECAEQRQGVAAA